MIGVLAATVLIFTLLFILLYHLTQRYSITVSLRETFLLSVMAASLLIVISTEGLSLLTLLTPSAIKITWLVTFIILFGWAAFIFNNHKNIFHALGQEFKTRLTNFKTKPWWFYLIALLIVCTFATTLLIIYQNPTPVYGDSMRYHLTRILVWETQASVRHYATHTLHQISFPPFAEYAIMQINFLVGNDHLARIVQWIALLVGSVAISDITKKLGADSKQQLISVLLFVSIPIVIVQSTRTMNDLVNAAWLMCFITFGLRFKKEPDNIFLTAITGLALSFALLTKSTAFIFALPFSLWLAISVLKREGFRPSVLKAGLVIILMILLINGRHFTDNMITFGSPLGDDSNLVNEIFSMRALASNSIRNIQAQMLPSLENVPEFIRLLGKGIKKITWNLHEITGMDPNDPKTTFLPPNNGFERPAGLTKAESAGSFIHLVLIFFAIILGLVRPREKEHTVFVIILIITFLLFSLLLKSQNWMNRLLLPYLVMWIPLITILLFRNVRRVWIIIPLTIWLASLPWLLNSTTVSLLPNPTHRADNWPSEGIEAYFVWRPELIPVYEEATSIILENQCDEVGIVYWAETSFFEYPFWIMLQENGFTGSIKHVLIKNESNIYEDLQYSPCIILSNTNLDDFPGYSLVTQSDSYWIYADN